MGIVDNFRDQAQACARLGSPLYAQLIGRLADDVAAGGVSREVLTGHEHDPGPSALALRLVGSVHRLVLDDRAPELAMFYPSVGGDWNPRSGWKAFEAVLDEHGPELRRLLEQPPQTNEVGRASALMGGLLRMGETLRLPVRLFEIGASGGLNLRADKFFYTSENGHGYGREDSPVQLVPAWRGAGLTPWDDLELVERVGADIAPVDVTTEDGRLTLASYVWPDQVDRLQRLRSAFRVAEDVPAEVRRQDAVSFVRDIELLHGTTTVLWHSVTWQYLSHTDQEQVAAAIDELGASATGECPFAHLSLEPTRRAPGAKHEFLVVLELWPSGGRHVLGTSVGHGIPTTWE